MQNFSVKYWQTEFSDILKMSYTLIKSLSFQEYKDSSNKYNTAYKQKQGQKSHDHLKRCGKSLWQNSISFHDKSSEVTRT
jgi:endo-alpha-1,4-polygalactosaminidase (GH114 family)